MQCRFIKCTRKCFLKLQRDSLHYALQRRGSNLPSRSWFSFTDLEGMADWVCLVQNDRESNSVPPDCDSSVLTSTPWILTMEPFDLVKPRVPNSRRFEPDEKVFVSNSLKLEMYPNSQLFFLMSLVCHSNWLVSTQPVITVNSTLHISDW